MFAITEFSRTTQRVVCMLMSVLVVSTSLAVGAYGAFDVAQPDYVVTIAQLQ